MLSITDIRRIHEKVYIPMYDRPLIELDDGNWRWEGKAFSRIPCLIEFRKIVEELGLCPKNMLVLNGAHDPEIEYTPSDRIVHGSHDEDPLKYDLHTMDLEEKTFDFIMCNQTLEHLYNPFKAMEVIHSHLEEGGLFFANAPVNNIPHDTPFHFYTGFTAVGIGALMVESGFDILKLGQWGNLKYLQDMFKNKWLDYKESSWENDPKCPVECWVLARKK